GSGFARQCVLVAAVGILFNAGISKLVDGGWRWLDGQSMQWYLYHTVRATRGGRGWPAFASIVESSPPMCRLLSGFPLALELGAPIALLSRKLRHLFIFLALSLHVGIWALMGLAFMGQSWCYILVVDWQYVKESVATMRRPAVGSVVIS